MSMKITDPAPVFEHALDMQRREPQRSYHVHTFISLGDGYWKMNNLPRATAVWREGLEHFAGNAALQARLAAKGPDLQRLISDTLDADVRIGTLGSGSDYTPFIQHLGVPSTDIGSEGSYGLYHSAFDNYNWFVKFADPTFAYEQQQARIFGLEILHMANADVLPYDYQLYGKEIVSYIETAHRHAATAKLNLNFAPALAAAHRFESAGTTIRSRQLAPPADPASLNRALRGAESALLNPDGLPHRPGATRP